LAVTSLFLYTSCSSSSFHFLSISPFVSFFFFFNHTPTSEIYTLSLHDALPICVVAGGVTAPQPDVVQLADFCACVVHHLDADQRDRKSTRLNSSHSQISYAVFCLKKKKKKKK